MDNEENDLHKDGYFSKNENFCKIIRKIAEGKKSALRDFYVTFGKGIYSLAISVCNSPEDADEIVNDVLAKVWNSAELLLNFDNPDGWLYRVTVNAAHDKVRYEEWLPLDEYIPYESNGFEKVNDNDAFYRYIRFLSKDERNVVTLRIVEDLTFAAIAATTDSQVSTVSTLYYRALQKIKDRIKQMRNKK